MRLRGVSHVELNVPDYQTAIAFYDRMFGWLGYGSFSTLGIEYVSTYYIAFPHSYIGIQPAAGDTRLQYEHKRIGINHVALWAHSRSEVRQFYREFLLPESVVVLDEPDFCPTYTPNYFAVFFLDPYGIKWELGHLPFLPSPIAIVKWWAQLAKIGKQHPAWRRHPFFESRRLLPSRRAKKG